MKRLQRVAATEVGITAEAMEVIAAEAMEVIVADIMGGIMAIAGIMVDTMAVTMDITGMVTMGAIIGTADITGMVTMAGIGTGIGMRSITGDLAIVGVIGICTVEA